MIDLAKADDLTRIVSAAETTVSDFKDFLERVNLKWRAHDTAHTTPGVFESGQGQPGKLIC